MIFVEGHEAANAEARSLLEEDKKIALSAVEVTAQAELELFLEDCRNMWWHRSLKMTMDQLWVRAWEQPSDRTAYLLWDHIVLSAKNQHL